MPAEELLERLSPALVKQEQSETGAIRLSATFRATPGLHIFDHVAAVVDGCVKAVLLDGEAKVGEAFFTLPYCGATKKSTLFSICRSAQLKPGQTYQVVFEPVHLWALETKETVRN